MKKAVAILMAITMVLAFASCGKQETTETEKVNINVYTSESQDLVTDMLEAFVAQNPDITYTLFRSGSGKVTAKIDTELETGSTDANILWIADLGYMSRLDEKGLITHYTPKAELDESFIYNDGMAVEVRQIFNIIAYNTLKCATPLSDWDDLANPELKGTFAMANPSYSGGALTTVVTHINNEEAAGWDLYQAYKTNDMKMEESNGNLQTKVASGEYQAVSVVDFMARNAANEGSPVATVWPESGAVMVQTPVTIIKNDDAKVTMACERLIEYLLSEECQSMFVSQGYIPVNPNVGVPEGAPAVADIKVMPLDVDFFIRNSSSIKDQFANLFTA